MSLKPDIVFLSYDEPNAEKNFSLLKKRYIRVKRLHGVTGVGRANILTAELVNTDWYYLIDADNVLLKRISLDFLPNESHKPRIIIWSAINPANGLIYGYGGIKLCHRDIMRKLLPDTGDVFTTCEGAVEFLKIPSSITYFNSSPYHAWRAAFRETISLTIMSKNGMTENGVISRLRSWQNPKLLTRYRKWIVRGSVDSNELIQNIGLEKAQIVIHCPMKCGDFFDNKYPYIRC